MSRDRYFQIMRYLHFVDNREEVKDKNSPCYDKLFKIRKVLDVLLPRFSEVYNPKRNLSIDETLIKFKGKIYFCQSIPIKHGRFGIKCFTLAEASCGYGLVSKVYTGKENGVVQRDLGGRAVTQPSIISDYNKNMGGVDLSDQRVTSYTHLMKGSVWYYKIFFYLLELSISNAQILMTKSFRDAPKMLQFR